MFDLALSEYAAFRDKDLVFTRELARRGILSKDQLLTLRARTALTEDPRERIHARIAADCEQPAPG
ncbi:MAG: hypothetical protein HIU85_03335 [Proteobacteria bacterium]|nr:hypothetical protein [Pseudomonadota bacterium]